MRAKRTMAGLIIIGIGLTSGFLIKNNVVGNPHEKELSSFAISSPLISVTTLPPQHTISPVVLPTPSPSPIKTLPTEVNLKVPFTVQAPHANWDEIHEEFCEEASVVIAMSYIQGKTEISPDNADAEMKKIKQFEEDAFGYFKDTTAEETARIIREFYKYDNVEIVQDPTIEGIQHALAQKKVIIAPAAGRLLHNPNFTLPGPIYHMLVIKGYTMQDEFITNDPGTRHGADYIYPQDVFMNALHDWPGSTNIEQGKKAIIVVG